MIIDENTQVMLRLHTQANNRGLRIYNPYFDWTATNAVYLLAHNPDPAPLLQGIRNLNIAGAIAAGFERNEAFPALLDDLTPEAREVGRVGIVINRDGKLTGHYQGGKGLYDSIVTVNGPFRDKTVTILGAGAVATGLLLEMQTSNDIPGSVTIINRDTSKAEALAGRFAFVKNTAPFTTLSSQQGDVFIDTTDIGSPWNKGEDHVYTPEFVKQFSFIGDVTFVPVEPQLIKAAQEAGVPYAPGHRMFMYQAKVCLERILDHTPELTVFEGLMLKDFEVNWS